MENNDQTTRSKTIRSFMQEIKQAFTDWVKQLPLIKRDIPEEPEGGDQEEKSAD